MVGRKVSWRMAWYKAASEGRSGEMTRLGSGILIVGVWKLENGNDYGRIGSWIGSMYNNGKFYNDLVDESAVYCRWNL